MHTSSLPKWLLLASTVHAASATAPIVVPPSLDWNGYDGQWSTFFSSIGSPKQDFRLLPGTSAEACTLFWVVIPIGCEAANPKLPDCAGKRGGLFQSNRSTSWSTETLENHADGAIYTLNLVEESHLGIAANGSYGFDTVTLGLGNGLPSLRSMIAGIWANEFFVGMLPLSPWPTNITYDAPYASPLGQLRNTSQIPSLSYGYTAGAYYQDSRTSKFGSLTLGGYDASRMIANEVSFSFGPDISRDLLLKLDSITYDTLGSSPLMTTSINVFINSLVSELWLPYDVCEQFRKSFNLTYNSPYYLIDSVSHAILVKQNPKFSFRLSNGTDLVTITLPYAAFDLNLTAPIVGNTTGYFPIRRAQNESQYVLGRTFLQEAYLTVDYERRKFSVSQAVFPSTAVQSEIVAIEVFSADVLKAGLSSGAIAGIAVAGVVAVVTVLLIVACWRKSRASKTETVVETENREWQPWHTVASKLVFWRPDLPEIHSRQRHEMDGGIAALELSSEPLYQELIAEKKKALVDNKTVLVVSQEPAELPAAEVPLPGR